MKIDIHNHFYPTRFLKQLEKDGPAVGITVEKDEWGRPIIVQHGNRVVTITPPMNDINKRLEDMERAGFDVQILTLSAPSVDIFPVEVGENLAKVVNDEIARICSEHPERFMGFATLPFMDSEQAVRELERVATYMPIYPARPEKKPPVMKAKGTKRESSPSPKDRDRKSTNRNPKNSPTTLYCCLI